MSRTRTSSAKAGPRKGRLAPSRLFGTLWKRGATEAALLVTAAAVAAGVVFGAGVARATSQTSDGQTWVSASDGTIVQINPVTGQPVSRIEIPLAGQVTVQQGNGVVLVTSAGTGKAVSIDVGQVTASRSRDVDPSTRKALLAPGGRTLIAELDTGVIRVVDSATMVDTGEAFVGPGPFVDVVIDKTSEVWALGTDGTLTSVHWSDDAHRFISDGTRSLAGVDAASRMVPHPRGVTVLSPSRKALVQVGTGADVQTIVDGMDGEIQPAESSPRDLVAATLTGRKAVMILDGDRVWKADLSAAGCDEPGRPAVFGDRIYVPCAGQGRTLVLDRTGQPARDAIVTGENDTPQIVGDDDSLVVTSAAAGTTVTVDAQGRQHRSEIRSPSIPVVKPKRADPSKAGGSVSASQTPSQPAAPTSSTEPTTEPDQPTSEPDQPTFEQLPPPQQQDPLPPSVDLTTAGAPSSPALPSPGQGTQPGTTSQTTGGTALDGPRNVRAEAVGPGVATVRWTAPLRRPDRYLVRTTDGAGSTQISGDAGSASITVSGRGSAQFVVVADFGADGLVQSQPSNVVNWTLQSTTGPSATSTVTTPRTTPTRPGPSPDCREPRPNGAGPATTGSCPSSSSPRPSTGNSGTGGSPSSQPSTTSGSQSSGGGLPSTVPTAPTTPAVPTTTPVIPQTTPTTPPVVPPTTSKPPVVPPTTSTPPPVEPSTPPPPPPTTEAPAPTTPPVEPSTPPPPPPTTEPPAPTPPAAPANFVAYSTGDGSSTNSVYVSWDAVAGVNYTMSLSKNGATPIVVDGATSPYEKAYGLRMSGTVTISLYGTQNGLTSETVTAQVELVPADMCNPLRAGSSWLHGLPMNNCCPNQPGQPICQIPLRADSSWLQPDVVTAVPTSGTGGRIALAIALLVLAGGVHLTRVRSRRRGSTPGTSAGGSLA